MDLNSKICYFEKRNFLIFDRNLISLYSLWSTTSDSHPSLKPQQHSMSLFLITKFVVSWERELLFEMMKKSLSWICNLIWQDLILRKDQQEKALKTELPHPVSQRIISFLSHQLDIWMHFEMKNYFQMYSKKYP